MAEGELSKSSLIKTRKKVSIYNSFLPSLNLKKQQLFKSYAEEKRKKADSRKEEQLMLEQFVNEIPMLANTNYNMQKLVEVNEVITAEENVVGIILPTYADITFKPNVINHLSIPFWFYRCIALMQQFLIIKAKQDIIEQRLQIISAAIVKATQKVNLFEKVLLPRAKQQVKKINIFLEDNDRASIVRSKMAKRKRLQVR